MITELLAMIGGNDDQRLAPLTSLVNRCHHAPKLTVNFANHPVVLRLQTAHLAFVAGRRHLGPTERGFVQGMTSLSLNRRDRKFDVGRVIKSGELPRRRVGRVRSQITQVREPARLLVRQPLGEARGEKPTQRVLGGPIGLASTQSLPTRQARRSPSRANTAPNRPGSRADRARLKTRAGCRRSNSRRGSSSPLATAGSSP